MTLIDIFRAARSFRRKETARQFRDEVLGTVRQAGKNRLESDSVEILQHEPHVAVTVRSASKEPVISARKALEELRNRYGDIRPAIADALCEYYESQDIWFRLQLKHVCIDMPGSEHEPKIELSYAPDWDPQHQLVVDLENWTPVNARMI